MRKHVRALPLLGLFAVPFVVAGGCSEPDTPIHQGALVRSVPQPVVGGSLETGLDATLAMMVDVGGGQLGGPSCTGTLITARRRERSARCRFTTSPSRSLVRTSRSSSCDPISGGARLASPA